ncbi:MAG: trypsin-like peptidase domain-containing protein [Oscillospiraceae bacterium]|nr:trypsin-like peptidase domain-containing protein [Oscillospiraceae bacterium]
MLKIDASGLTPVTLGNSDDMQVGESIYVVGNPLGELTYTMTAGIISALDREIAADRNTTVNMFQLDAAVNSGNSGGPVYNSRGQVIGVVTAKYNSTGVEGLGFAIPVNDARAIAEEIVDHGYVTGKPYLGIVVTNMTESEAQRYNTVAGVYVYSVSEGSCAEKAGLQQGDVIVELGGKTVATTSDLATVKKDYKAGDSCELKFYRSGKYQTVTVVFDEEPAQTAESGSASQEPREGAGQLPGFGGGQQPGSGDRPQPGDGEQGEDDKNGFGSFGDSFEDWMNDFFGRFYDYFGGGSSDDGGSDQDSDSDSDSGSSGGFRHFGT